MLGVLPTLLTLVARQRPAPVRGRAERGEAGGHVRSPRWSVLTFNVFKRPTTLEE